MALSSLEKSTYEQLLAAPNRYDGRWASSSSEAFLRDSGWDRHSETGTPAVTGFRP